MDLARQYLREHQYTDIAVVSYEDWLVEMDFVEKARKELLAKVGL